MQLTNITLYIMAGVNLSHKDKPNIDVVKRKKK